MVYATQLHHFFVYLCIVRIGHILFAFYLLFLAIYPCSDASSVSEQKSEIVTLAVYDHGNSTQDQDLCTPFCICVCCAAHIKLCPLADMDFAGVIHNTQETIPYIEKQLLSDYSHIWQPPKI
jgi:hypothetical protein